MYRRIFIDTTCFAFFFFFSQSPVTRAGEDYFQHIGICENAGRRRYMSLREERNYFLKSLTEPHIFQEP